MLDAHGKIGWGRSDVGGDPIVVVLSEAVSDTHLTGLRGEGLSYIFAGKSELDLGLALDILNRELGAKRWLCLDPLIVLFQLDLEQPLETQRTHLLRAENLGQVRAGSIVVAGAGEDLCLGNGGWAEG